MRRALSRKAASLLLSRPLRGLANSFDRGARLTWKTPTFGLILNCNFSNVLNGNKRVCSQSGHPGWRLDSVRELPVTHGGNPLNIHPLPPSPGGQWNCRLPHRCLAGERTGPYQPRLAGGKEGFPPLRLLLHRSSPKQPGEQPSLQSRLREAVGLAELLGQ